MAGAALSLFTDFFTNTTGPAYFSGPDSIINDAQMRNFAASEAFFRTKKEVQGGSTIKDMVFLTDPGTAATYLPGEAATITNVQGGNTISVPWRFIRVPITWTEQEILLNQGGMEQSSTSQFHQYKKLKDFKFQQGYTSLINLLEKLFFAAANNASMEAATGTEPYSIFASVTTDGLAPAGFTTVEGLNPTNETNWRNQNTTYQSGNPYDVDVGLIAGFDTLSQLVVFKRPPNSQQYFDEAEWRRLVIFTNREGRRMYMKAIRSNNDITRAGPQDPSYGQPVFNNVPVIAAEGLDTQASFGAGVPDFLFLNMNYLKCIFHREKFLNKGDTMTWADKPDTVVCWVDTYVNLFACSRLRLGYLDAA